MTLVNDDLLNVFFSSGFEEPAEVHLDTGAKNILGHFYDKYERAKMMGIDVDASSPMLEVKASDVPGIKQNNKVITRGIEFYVHEVQNDGEGFTYLILYYGND